jgi:hypothetical protein
MDYRPYTFQLTLTILLAITSEEIFAKRLELIKQKTQKAAINSIKTHSQISYFGISLYYLSQMIHVATSTYSRSRLQLVVQ